MNKKGQIFLIAAIVIIIIMAGLGVVYNSANTKTKDNQVYDLSKELNYESGKVLEYGKLNTGVNIDSQISELATYYSNSNFDSDIIVVYGNKDGAKIINMSKINRGSIGLANSGISLTATTDSHPAPINIKEGKVTIKYKETPYEFELKEGENFFFVISKNKGDEQIVAAK